MSSTRPQNIGIKAIEIYFPSQVRLRKPLRALKAVSVSSSKHSY